MHKVLSGVALLLFLAACGAPRPATDPGLQPLSAVPSAAAGTSTSSVLADAQSSRPTMEPPIARPTLMPQGAYAEIEPAYEILKGPVMAWGTDVSKMVAAGDIDGLFDRFDADLQAQVPLSQLRDTIAGFTQTAPIGEPLSTRFANTGKQAFYYAAAHAWGSRQLGVYAAFDPAGQVDDLVISPLQPPLDPAHDYQSALKFRLPFDDLWYVAWGGPDELHNYHVTVPMQRYAYDLVIWKDGGTCRGDCAANEDYYTFGQPILAPAAGEVMVAVGNQPDQPPGHVMDAVDPGNYVILKVADGEYLFIGHMQQGSVLVAAGDRVTTGQPIGRAGNSGRTSEPHIHIHLQDLPRFALTGVASLPLYFSDYLADGQPVVRGMPLGSQFVQFDSGTQP